MTAIASLRRDLLDAQAPARDLARRMLEAIAGGHAEADQLIKLLDTPIPSKPKEITVALSPAEEISTDPLARGYSGMTPQQILDDVHTEYRTRINKIPSNELLAWSGAADRYEKIKAAADDPANAANSIAHAAIGMINRSDTSLDLNRSDHTAMLDTLVATGALTQADADSLTTIATESISRVVELNWVQPFRLGNVEEVL